MIERCADYRRIKKQLEWPLVVSNEFYYLIETVDGIDLGVWALHPWHNGVLIHASMGEKCRGRAAVESGKNALKWIFDHTEFDRIYAKTSNDIRASQFVASWMGMECVKADETHRYYIAEAEHG